MGAKLAGGAIVKFMTKRLNHNIYLARKTVLYYHIEELHIPGLIFILDMLSHIGKGHIIKIEKQRFLSRRSLYGSK